MKKTFSVLFALLSLIVLVGCTPKVKFNDGLKFTQELTTAEKKAVIAKVYSELNNVVEVTTETYQRNYNEIEETEESTKVKMTAYSNLLIHMDASTTQTTKSSDLTVSKTVKLERDIFDYREKKMIILYAKTDEGDIDTLFIDYEKPEEIEEKFYSQFLLGNVVGQLQNLEAYAQGTGYVFVQQQVNKQVQGVAWGNDVKESVVTTKNQLIVKIDKNYKVTEFTQMNETSRNRDTQTNAWYKSETQTAYDSQKTTLKYGAKKADTKKVDNLINMLSGTVIQNVNIQLEDKLGHRENATVEVKYNGLNKMHVIATWQPMGLTGEEPYVFKFLFGYEAKVGFEDKKVEDLQLQIGKEGQAYSETFQFNFLTDIKFVFEFDITVNNSTVTTTYVDYWIYS